MAKETFPQQLDLPLDFPVSQVQLGAKLSATTPDKQSHVVLDFMVARAERQATVQASLYRQIIDSVRHLG